MFLTFFLLLVGVIPAADGVKIKYEVTGRGEPALVFIHCWSCDRTLWENQVAAFAKTNRVVTIDLPGHGEAGKERKTWSIESFGDDVNRVVTKLRLRRVVLIGSSMGGPVALEAAKLMPDRLVGIVPVDTLQDVDQLMPVEQRNALLGQLRADYKSVMPALMNQFLFAKGTPDAVKKRMIDKALEMSPEIGLPMLENIVGHDSVAALKTVKVPIKAINSDLNPTNLEGNRKHAPQFSATIMSGVGHYPMLEDPARFNSLLGSILREMQVAPMRSGN